MASPSLRDYEQWLRVSLAANRIREAVLDGFAGEYDPEAKLIRYDPFYGGQLEVVVHELVHHGHYRKLAGLGAMEEPTTLAWEDELVRFINRSKTRTRWWRRALAAKMMEGE